MKGDRELEKLLSEIPSPQSSHHHYNQQHYQRQMMGFGPNCCYNVVSVSDDGTCSLSSSSSCCCCCCCCCYCSNNNQAPNSHPAHQLMVMGSIHDHHHPPPPDHCYWRTNNGYVVVDELGGLTGQFQNKMNLNVSLADRNNNNDDENNTCRQGFVLVTEGQRRADDSTNNNGAEKDYNRRRCFQGLSASACVDAASVSSRQEGFSNSAPSVPYGEKARCLLGGHRGAAFASVNVIPEPYVAAPPTPPPQNPSNSSSSLYSPNTSYYSCPINYPEEIPGLLENDCSNNSLQTPSSLYHHSPSCVADPPPLIQQHSDEVSVFNSSSRLVFPMYNKPYSHEPILHPSCTGTNMNSSDLVHALPVDNAVYKNPPYWNWNWKARIRADDHHNTSAENRGPLFLMKTRKKLDTYGCLEDTYLIQESCLNGVSSAKYDPSSRVRVRTSGTTVPFLGDKSLEFNTLLHPHKISENGTTLVDDCHPFLLQPTLNSLSDLQGNIYLIAKDQHGCRFLQNKFEQGSYQDVEIIFNEIIDRIVDLMMNPFGNYLIQKLLDVCHEQQRMTTVHMVTREPGELVRISLNTHGTRVVQKLIETLTTHEQISLVVLALEPGFLNLIKDLNGNHVIQRCLQCLSTEDNKFIFDAAAKYCVDIATHRHGCCVLQRCIDHSNGEQRQNLIVEICANGLLLAQDPFGNYVVQYILEKKIPSASAELVSQFEGHYVHLSMQKFSSHVVEKCLKFYEDSRPRIVHELLSVSHFEQVLQDQYANYVIQSALDVTKGVVHDSLVAAVRPHTILRTNPYCKKIFSRGLLKK